MADVHYMPEAALRLVAWLTMCLMRILANAAHAQAPSDPQGLMTPTDWLILTITTFVVVIALGVWLYRLTH